MAAAVYAEGAALGPWRGGLRGYAQADRAAVLVGVHDLGAGRLIAAPRPAQRADEGSGVIAVDVLAGQRRAPAVGAARARAGQRADPLPQQLALEVDAKTWHGGEVRRVG